MGFFELIKRWRPASTPGATPTAVERPGPATSTDAAGAQERRERERRGARPGTRILVVDDSPTIVTLLKRMLQQNHFDVRVAYDGESALEIAQRERPDLVFLDIVLPGIDGFSTLRKLRRDPATKDVPVIMISGNAQATEQFYVQRIGADDFMKKPFTRAEVFTRIERLLDSDGVPRHLASSVSRRQTPPPAPG